MKNQSDSTKRKSLNELLEEAYKKLETEPEKPKKGKKVEEKLTRITVKENGYHFTMEAITNPIQIKNPSPREHQRYKGYAVILLNSAAPIKTIRKQ